MTCQCKTYEFKVLVTVPTNYGDAAKAAMYLKDRIEDADKELAENAENLALTPSRFYITTTDGYAADRAGCLIDACVVPRV